MKKLEFRFAFSIIVILTLSYLFPACLPEPLDLNNLICTLCPCPEGLSCHQNRCLKIKSQLNQCSTEKSEEKNHRNDASSLEAKSDATCKTPTRTCKTSDKNCPDGTQTCSKGVWSSCQPNPKETPEACNQKDDDCDGIVDELCFTTVAGNGAPQARDGIHSWATTSAPHSMVVVEGADQKKDRIYFSDSGSHQIRMLYKKPNGKEWYVKTIAGTDEAGFRDKVKGAKAEAQFSSPAGLAYDKKENALFIADSGNHKIRRIELTDGYPVTTIAGTHQGYRDGASSDARLSSPSDVIVIRQTNGPLTLFVADYGNHAIRKIYYKNNTYDISTFSDKCSSYPCTPGFKDGLVTNARFHHPHSMAFDSKTNRLYLTEKTGNRIRQIQLNQELTKSTVQLLAGSEKGSPGLINDKVLKNVRFDAPTGVAIIPKVGLLIADQGNHMMRTLFLPEKNKSTQSYPEQRQNGYYDGAPKDARFYLPTGITPYRGAFLLADTGNNRIRIGNKLLSEKDTPKIETILGHAGSPAYQEGLLQSTSQDPTKPPALFSYAEGLAYHEKRGLAIADTWNHVIRKLLFEKDPKKSKTLLLTGGKNIAGTTQAQRPGYEDKDSTEARFAFPTGLTYFGEFLYIADSRNALIRQYHTSGIVRTLIGKSKEIGDQNGNKGENRLRCPHSLTFDKDGILYVTDSDAHNIRKFQITQSGGTTKISGSTLAGPKTGPPNGRAGFKDGMGEKARFNTPHGIAIGPDGQIYVADTQNHVIRKINPKNGVVKIYAGIPKNRGTVNGPTLKAKFNLPHSIAFDKTGNLFVTDRGSHTIRKISADTKEVSTFAGKKNEADYVDARGDRARFYSPTAILITAQNIMYILDSRNYRIRRAQLD